MRDPRNWPPGCDLLRNEKRTHHHNVLFAMSASLPDNKQGFHSLASIGEYFCDDEKAEMQKALADLAAEDRVIIKGDEVILAALWEPRDLIDTINSDIDRRVSLLGPGFAFRFHPEKGYYVLLKLVENNKIKYLSGPNLEAIYKYLRENHPETDFWNKDSPRQ
jgi:hypothetical protein